VDRLVPIFYQTRRTNGCLDKKEKADKLLMGDSFGELEFISKEKQKRPSCWTGAD